MKDRRDNAHGKDVWTCDGCRVGDGGMGRAAGLDLVQIRGATNQAFANCARRDRCSEG